MELTNAIRFLHVVCQAWKPSGKLQLFFNYTVNYFYRT